MALALYRKYRPATFAEVVGQDHVTQPLQTALAAGRINHAYLFSGPRGCGKTSSARIMARSLNCVQGPTPDPCGVCTSCVALAPEGPGSIDVVELDAASHGGVDDTRELRDRAFYMPAESRYRIFIIDEAHMVSAQGFNALLKIVEEPPEHIVFIFATTEPDKVMTTIRSRTHHYPFRLIPPATLRKLLERLCAEEGVHVEPAVFPLVIQAGGGSARDSLSILDQLLAGAGPEGVTYRSAVALLGVTDVALLDEAVDALAANDGASVFGAVDKVVEAGHDPRRFASDLLQRFRDLVILAAVPDAVTKGLIDAPEDQVAAMTGQATRFGPATLTRIADILHTGLTDMRGTTAPRLALELMCARMLLPAAATDEAALIQRLERLERAGGGAPGVASSTPAAAPAASAPRSARDSGRAAVAAPGTSARVASVPPAGPSADVTASAPKAAASVSDGSVEGVRAASTPPAVRAGTGTEAPVRPTGADETAGEDFARPEASGRGTYRRPSREPGAAAAPTTTARGGNDAGAAPKSGGLGLPPPPVLSSASRRPTSASTPPPAATVQPPATVGQQRAPAGPGSSGPDQRVAVAAPGKPASDSDYVPPEAPPPDPDLEPPVDESDDGEVPSPASIPAPAPAPTGVSAPAPTEASPSPAQPAGPLGRAGEKGRIDVTDVRRVWGEVLAAIHRTSKTARYLVEQQATVASLADGVLTLSVESPNLARRVSEAGNIRLLRNALKEVLSADVAVRVVPVGAAGVARPTVAVLPPAAEPSDFGPGDEPMEESSFDQINDSDRQIARVRHPDQLAVDLLVEHVGAKRVDPL